MRNRLDEIAAAQRHAHLSRRHFLRGVGACVALPALQSLLPAGSGKALAAITEGAGGRLATTATGAPLRMAWVYVPNGAISSAWWPEGDERNFTLNQTMAPLAKLKEKIQIVSGFDCMEAAPGPDGGGDHARAAGSFLTGVRAKKSSTDVRAGVSIDQLAAKQIGHLTAFPSLELTCDDVRTTGSCDSGYACSYQFNLAWRSATNPVVPEPNPRLLFERLFGTGAPGERNENFKKRTAQQRSILDYVLGDVDAVQGRLGSRDKMKLDEYLTCVRATEQRIENAERRRDKALDPAMATPAGIPEDYQEYLQVMFDMLLLAFQTDQTRIATFMMAYEGSNRTFGGFGFPEGHHTCTHHNNRQELIDKTKRIELWYMTEFARFLEKMEQTKDVDGNSVLSNSMICYGSGHSDANRHLHNNLPIILAGGGGGALTPNRYIGFGSKPVTNLWLSLTDRLGVQGLQRHGDSTGRVEGL